MSVLFCDDHGGKYFIDGSCKMCELEKRIDGLESMRKDGKTYGYVYEHYIDTSISDLIKRIEALESKITETYSKAYKSGYDDGKEHKKAEESELEEWLEFINDTKMTDIGIREYAKAIRQLAIRKVDGINIGLNENWYDALQRMKKALEVM